MINLIICTVLNFAILLFLLFKFVVPRISEAMDKKQKGIVQSIEETEKSLADINKELEAHSRQMADVEKEIASILQEAEIRGNAAANKVEEDTIREVDALRIRMERQIEQEFSSLQLRLRADLVQQVVATVQDMASQRLDKAGHAALVEDFAFSLKDFKEFKS
jgi:F-type H+-transporting ATPase subunit b